MIYARAFSIQNCIKKMHSNRMLTKNLASVLKIVLEGLIHGCHNIFDEVIRILKNNTKFTFFFSYLECYLTRHEDPREDDNC